MQVLIGAVISQSDQIGTWLFLWAMLAIWVLGQFFLQREAQRLLPAMAGGEPYVLRTSSVDPYRGLSTSVYMIASRVMATTLALGGLIFLILPRQAGATRAQSGAPIARHLTGFDEEVQLGQFGEILENDTVVMTVEFSDEDGKTIRPGTEPLWRGVTMLRYEKGRWRRQAQRHARRSSRCSPTATPSGATRSVRSIKLEPNDSADAVRHPADPRHARLPARLTPYLNPIDGTLFRPDPRGGAYDYEVFPTPIRGPPDGTRIARASSAPKSSCPCPKPLKAQAAEDRRADGRQDSLGRS